MSKSMTELNKIKVTIDIDVDAIEQYATGGINNEGEAVSNLYERIEYPAKILETKEELVAQLAEAHKQMRQMKRFIDYQDKMFNALYESYEKFEREHSNCKPN